MHVSVHQAGHDGSASYVEHLSIERQASQRAGLSDAPIVVDHDARVGNWVTPRTVNEQTASEYLHLRPSS